MIIDIHGINVKFPFEPYDLQKDYMKKVIEALEGHQNAVLESPTGLSLIFNYVFKKFHNLIKFYF